MSEETPRFNQLNLVVEDMYAAVAFYQALGMTVRLDGGEEACAGRKSPAAARLLLRIRAVHALGHLR